MGVITIVTAGRVSRLGGAIEGTATFLKLSQTSLLGATGVFWGNSDKVGRTVDLVVSLTNYTQEEIAYIVSVAKIRSAGHFPWVEGALQVFVLDLQKSNK